MRKNISGISPFESTVGFSRAVRVDNTVYLAGTGPAGAEDQDAENQTRLVFAIAAQALAEAGASLHDVIRTRIFLTHIEDWQAVARVHSQFFQNVRPAATMVVVAALLDPAWRVEIEMEAVIADPASGAPTDQ